MKLSWRALLFICLTVSFFVPPLWGEEELALPSLDLSLASPEAEPFLIKGTKLISFTSRQIEGSKEGFVSGLIREESLRLNIFGRHDGTEIEANLINVSAAGSGQIGQREEKLSVKAKRGEHELYLGDFETDLEESEFARLDKVVSGVQLKSAYQNWGLKAFYSSPKGEGKVERFYGEGTQGPFRLSSAPVVIESERVYLDGRRQQRGDDYTVDYQAGTVSFVKKTIDQRSVVDIYYDFQGGLYRRSLYGFRLTNRPFPGWKLGGTYLNNSDEPGSGGGEPATLPVGHQLIGVDGVVIGENFVAAGEAAYSIKDHNLLAAGSTESGRALKLELKSSLGPFALELVGKRVGATFFPVADPDPKQRIEESNFGLSWRPSSLGVLQSRLFQEKYWRSGVYYDNFLRSLRGELTPVGLPLLELNLSERGESNDPVSGSLIRRTINRQAVESRWQAGWLAATVQRSTEQWQVASPSTEGTEYDRWNFGLAAVGLDNITFSSNLELEERRLPDKTLPHRAIYRLNTALSPDRAYYLAATLQLQEDSLEGPSNVAEISGRAELFSQFKLDARYSAASLKELYATAEAVSKQSGSFGLDWRLGNGWRGRFLYRPNFTQILRTGTLGYTNEQRQAEVNFPPWQDALAGVLYKEGSGFTVDSQDQPAYTRQRLIEENDSLLYTLKFAPWRIFSVELNYLTEGGESATLVTGEGLVYNRLKKRGVQQELVWKTSLAERMAIDLRLTSQDSRQVSGESFDLVRGRSEGANLKVTWNATEHWSWSLGGAFSRNIDELAAEPLSYTLAPACGLIYRQGEELRFDLDYSYALTYAGIHNEKQTLALRLKYNLSEFVSVIFRGTREISQLPWYRLTDLAGNIEIKL